MPFNANHAHSHIGGKDRFYSQVANGTWETDDGEFRWNVSQQVWEPKPQSVKSVNQERTDSMLFTVAVTTRVIVNTSTNQVIKPEEVVVPPDNTILAADQNVAMVLFGAKHADELAKADPSLWVVQIRQGV